MNPLDVLGVKREHLISLHEAFTHTNKQTSNKRARYLLELLEILKSYDEQRNKLQWDEFSVPK